MPKKYYITTPIYYVNSAPHLGHAYASVSSDAIARFKRLEGFDVRFLTGTDEHGQKVEKAAIKSGVKTKDFVDSLVPEFRSMLEYMNCTNDDFIRTTEARHIQYVQNIWRQLHKRNQIYLGKYCGWYSIRDEAFFSEEELVDGKAPSGAEVEWMEEESYFFRLSQWQEKLLEFYDQNPDFIYPETRRNEVISFVKRGLRDLSVSRTSFKWGIQVPERGNHIIYVWLDALFNYISAISTNDLIDYWPCNLHIIGKDILIFHCVYWPAFLMSLDIKLPLKVFAHGWWLQNNEKMSKSLGNVVSPSDLVQEFGSDYVRYFLLREVIFGHDGNYTREAFITRINSDLVNNIGNLFQRVMSFIYKHCEKKIPHKESDFILEDQELLQSAYKALDKMIEMMNNQSIHNAIGVIIDLGNKSNAYIDKCAPWHLKNSDTRRMNTVLYVLAEAIRVIGILLQPFVPEGAAKILSYLGINQCELFTKISSEFAIKSEYEIGKPEIIFERLYAYK